MHRVPGPGACDDADAHHLRVLQVPVLAVGRGGSGRVPFTQGDTCTAEQAAKGPAAQRAAADPDDACRPQPAHDSWTRWPRASAPAPDELLQGRDWRQAPRPLVGAC